MGAGPAGAPALRGSGLRVLLLNKATFPRDKGCGDAVPGHALKVLAQLDPAYGTALWQVQPRDEVRRSRLVAPGGASFYLHWQLPIFNSPRLDFDAALLALVRQHTTTEIRENAALKNIGITPRHARLHLADGTEISARLVIGCDGATSVVGRRWRLASRLLCATRFQHRLPAALRPGIAARVGPAARPPLPFAAPARHPALLLGLGARLVRLPGLGRWAQRLLGLGKREPGSSAVAAFPSGRPATDYQSLRGLGSLR